MTGQISGRLASAPRAPARQPTRGYPHPDVLFPAPAQGDTGTPSLSQEQPRKLRKYEHLGSILFASPPPLFSFHKMLI